MVANALGISATIPENIISEIEYKRYNVYLEFFNEMFEYKYHYKEKMLEIGCGVGTDLVRFAKNGVMMSL